MNSYIGIFFCLIAILILQKIKTSNQFHEKNGSDHLLGCREQDMSIFVNGILWKYLTAVFFETGAMSTPTKSQNPTNCGWGGSFQSYLTHF